jgi:hypothetical protein
MRKITKTKTKSKTKTKTKTQKHKLSLTSHITLKGRDSRILEKGTSALLTVELDEEVGRFVLGFCEGERERERRGKKGKEGERREREREREKERMRYEGERRRVNILTQHTTHNNRSAKEVRVTQGKEPKHFLSVFRSRFVLHLGKATDVVKKVCVWGCEVWGCEVWGCEVWGCEVWGCEVWGCDCVMRERDEGNFAHSLKTILSFSYPLPLSPQTRMYEIHGDNAEINGDSVVWDRSEERIRAVEVNACGVRLSSFSTFLIISVKCVYVWYGMATSQVERKFADDYVEKVVWEVVGVGVGELWV